MTPPSYRGYHFPADVIQRAVWMYLRFTLSYREVEDLLAERGIQVSYETVRRWVHVFGPGIARRLRARRPRPHGRWHLDEMFIRIDGKQMYLWRAVDAEGEVLDVLLQLLDAARVTVATGTALDFSGFHVWLTSNVGAAELLGIGLKTLYNRLNVYQASGDGSGRAPAAVPPGGL